jgi:hypothetical protein
LAEDRTNPAAEEFFFRGKSGYGLPFLLGKKRWGMVIAGVAEGAPVCWRRGGGDGSTPQGEKL